MIIGNDFSIIALCDFVTSTSNKGAYNFFSSPRKWHDSLEELTESTKGIKRVSNDNN